MKILFLMFCIAAIVSLPAIGSADDYIIGDGDELQISVWGEQQLDAKVVVRPDGKITLPGIGDAEASGFAPMVLGQKLAERLEAFVKKAIVTVTVVRMTNNKIYVFGGGVAQGQGSGKEGEGAGTSGSTQSVWSAGVHNMPGRTTLLKFLTGLGNLRGADLEHAYIIRDGKKLDVDFYALFMKAELSKDVALKSEDMIFLPDNTNNKIYVMGAVNAPKAVFYWKGVKILDVILDAGGFTKFASENSVVVMRQDADQKKIINVKVKDLMKEGDLGQNITLLPGDFVIVKESIF
ncbi:Polysaccharide export protein, PEP-CTERM sytem-associated [Candidatus Sulfobium mesophilum]|uniref:Polysaccharide export protein, PEP-CTERM sytem-associated n=1 Tax=Candidatus Sulfobium mesophilum TaxID=2016548 RepID=A0A2U3QDK9_9BACT|nr:Polysaccharide export protein, PEP-CTERM sytem-associated [Candidatus Sulfobium mesophilum]